MPTSNLQLTADSSQIRSAKNDLDDLNASSARVSASQRGLESNSGRSGRAMGLLGRQAGQASIQVQQFVGQIQGGQSALLALSQQGADLGIVLGRAGLGAAVGIAASALSFLAFSSGDAEDKLSKLDVIVEKVGETLKEASDGSDVFSESILELAERSESLARIQIAQTLSDLTDQINESAAGVRSLVGGAGLASFNSNVAELGITFEDLAKNSVSSADAVDQFGAGGVAAISKVNRSIRLLEMDFDITRGQAVGLASAISDFQSDQGAVGISRLRSEIEDLESELGGSNQKFNELAASLLPFFDSTRSGVDRTNLLRQALADLSGVLSDNSEDSKSAAESSRSLTLSLETQILALQEGERAAAIFALEQNAVTLAQKEQLPTLIALTNQRFDLVESQKQAALTARAEAQAQAELDRTLTQVFANGEKLEQQRQRELERQSASFESLRQRLVLEQTSLTLGNERLELERNLLALGESDGSQDFQDRVTAITDLTLQLQALRNEAELIGPALDQSLRQIGLSAIDEISSGLAGVISQGDSLRDTIGSIANTILNDLLTAAIRYFVGSAAQALISQSVVTTGAVASNTAITASATPAAAATTIATSGGSAVAGVSALTSAIPAIASLFATGFESGGFTGTGGRQSVAGVVHGQEFVVNARNTARNRSTLEAMNRGEDVSGSNVIVNITNNSSNSDVQTTDSTGPNDERIIDIVVANIDQRGRIQRSITRNTTAANRI